MHMFIRGISEAGSKSLLGELIQGKERLKKYNFIDIWIHLSSSKKQLQKLAKCV